MIRSAKPSAGSPQSAFWGGNELLPKSSPNQRRNAPGTNAELFAKLDADLFLGHQLFRHGCSGQMLTGVTTAAERCERIRREILASGLDDAMVLPGSSAALKTPETIAQAFERLYGEPLIPTKRKGKCDARNSDSV